jgi:preprotein translocase subunit YajC
MHRILILLASSLLVAIAGLAAESGGPDPAQIAPPPGSTGGAGKAAAPEGISPSFMLIMGVGILFIWLVLIRPQKKEEKKRQELVASVKPGHKVITIGGVHGEVTAVGEATVDVRIGEEGKGVVVTFNKGAIATNVTAAAAAAPAK